MFAQRLKIVIVHADGSTQDCPLKWIDNFAMRNFTNDAIFDDTLPLEDGLMEVGNRVPVEGLRLAMEDWLRRKGWLKTEDKLNIRNLYKSC
jgi:hypothetical protein